VCVGGGLLGCAKDGQQKEFQHVVGSVLEVLTIPYASSSCSVRALSVIYFVTILFLSPSRLVLLIMLVFQKMLLSGKGSFLPIIVMLVTMVFMTKR
jgi:hypothetical protein